MAHKFLSFAGLTAFLNRFKGTYCGYAECSTAAGTAAKTVTLANFKLIKGAKVIVRFTITNTAASPTLNVNGTGAKAIYYKGAAITAGYLVTNSVYEFVYNGTRFDLISDETKEPIITAGTSSQYRRGDKTWQDFATAVRAATLTGLSTATNAAIAAADTALTAFGKLQAQVNARLIAGNIKAGTNVNVSASGNDVTISATNTTYNNATTSSAGLMTATDKSKLDGIASGADVTATSMSGSAAKTTLIDADTMPLSDSAASNAIKKITWANIKAVLKTYFDTLYNKTTVNNTLTSTSTVEALSAAQGKVLNDAKAPLASPALTGTPTAPTAASSVNNTQLATTAFVTTAVANKTAITGNAGTATVLQTTRTIDGVNFNGSAAITHYGECTTASATAAKTAAIDGFTLVKGARATVRFASANTNAAPTLNINSTGAKEIHFQGARITNAAPTMQANMIYDFIYTGTCYELIGNIASGAGF